MYKSQEINVYVKRDPCVWKKRSMCMAKRPMKETHTYRETRPLKETYETDL